MSDGKDTKNKSKARTARTNRNKGKRFEKRFAEMLGTINIGLYGGEDIWHPNFSFECKDYNKFIGQKWMNQAIANNKRDVTPAVAVHVTGTSYDNSYIMLRWEDFRDMFLNNVEIKPR